MLDVLALWIGRAFLLLAGFLCSGAVLYWGLELWWKKIGREARTIMVTAFRERGKIEEARRLAKLRRVSQGGEE
jgi:hypothetical protein